ncbi:MAG: peptidoglycan-binding domain-containing protein [Candidatus Entotheonellia bacterium]
MRRTLMICMIVALAALPLLAGAQPASQIPEGRSTEGYLIPEGAQPRESSFEATPDRDIVREAQIALRDAGYEPGRIDGVMGSKTQAALRKFQASQGLPQTGRLDSGTQQQLLAAHMPESSRRR